MQREASGADLLVGRRVLLGVAGGIGAYKAAILARLLVTAGAEVDAVLTRGARRFVGAATFEGITGRAVRDDVFDGIAEETHVALGRRADVAVLYPATAHLIARLAHGLADDLLTTTLLASRAPLVVAPAMHTEMWTHPATQANVTLLRERGARLVGPDDGPLMGGDAGAGRLVEPHVARDALRQLLEPHRGDLAGLRILVTAGGTREAIDPVRFVGNRSSGRMGFALAAVAAARGAEVTLVAAPAGLPTPVGVERIDVTTAREMHDAVMSRCGEVDVVLKAAAVADFRPKGPAVDKLKKSGGAPVIEFEPNPDILRTVADRRGAASRPFLVGFAAETSEPQAHGRAKLAAKGVDLLVVNDVSRTDIGFDVADNEVILLGADGTTEHVARASKEHIAGVVLDRVTAFVRAGA